MNCGLAVFHFRLRSSVMMLLYRPAEGRRLSEPICVHTHIEQFSASVFSYTALYKCDYYYYYYYYYHCMACKTISSTKLYLAFILDIRTTSNHSMRSRQYIYDCRGADELTELHQPTMAFCLRPDRYLNIEVIVS